MKKILTAIAATAAIASPLALTATAEAATITSPAPTCTPIVEVAGVAAVSHTEYQWAALVAKPKLHWDYKWTATPVNPSTDISHIWVKSLDLTKKGAPQITQTVIDRQAVAAVDGVTCEIPFPANPLVGLNGISPTAVVPTPAGTEKYTFSPVVNHIALNGKIGTTATTKPGYVFPGGLTSKVYAATPDNSAYVFLSGAAGKHIELPDTFLIEHTADGFPGYYSTQVSVIVVNDTATDRNFSVMYKDQQPGPLWIERAIFTDGQPGNVVPAGGSRTLVFDVWYDQVSPAGADVPDDLAFDFGYELG